MRVFLAIGNDSFAFATVAAHRSIDIALLRNCTHTHSLTITAYCLLWQNKYKSVRRWCGHRPTAMDTIQFRHRLMIARWIYRKLSASPKTHLVTQRRLQRRQRQFTYNFGMSDTYEWCQGKLHLCENNCEFGWSAFFTYNRLTQGDSNNLWFEYIHKWI